MKNTIISLKRRPAPSPPSVTLCASKMIFVENTVTEYVMELQFIYMKRNVYTVSATLNRIWPISNRLQEFYVPLESV